MEVELGVAGVVDYCQMGAEVQIFFLISVVDKWGKSPHITAGLPTRPPLILSCWKKCQCLVTTSHMDFTDPMAGGMAFSIP